METEGAVCGTYRFSFSSILRTSSVGKVLSWCIKLHGAISAVTFSLLPQDIVPSPCAGPSRIVPSPYFLSTFVRGSKNNNFCEVPSTCVSRWIHDYKMIGA